MSLCIAKNRLYTHSLLETPFQLHAMILKLYRGVRTDLAHMTTFLSHLSSSIGYDLQLSTLKDSAISDKSISHWFLNLSPSEEDMVFFYYSGHGRYDMKRKRWPVIYLAERSSLAGVAIIRYARTLNAKSCFLLFDCCNKWDLKGTRVLRPCCFDTKSTQPVPYQGLKKLFLSTNGLLIAAAASPHEVASFISSQKGSQFTSFLLDTIYTHCNQDNPEWDSIFQKTRTLCAEAKRPHHPFYRIETCYFNPTKLHEPSGQSSPLSSSPILSN